MKKNIKNTKRKSFANHRNNGVYLEFPNGVSISTVWGYGNYCENYDWEHPDGKVSIKNMTAESVMKQFEKIPEGSSDVEIMIFGASDIFIRRLSNEFGGGGDNPWGYINIMDWLKIVNRCANYRPRKKKS